MVGKFDEMNRESILISSRDINKIVQELDTLTLLKSIKIVKEGLPTGEKTLPIEITKLTKLEKLSFEYPFLSLPEEIENLKGLKKLEIPINLKVTDSQKMWILELIKKGCRVTIGERLDNAKPEWLEKLVQEKNMPAKVAIKTNTKLTSAQIEKFLKGYEELYFHSKDDVLSTFLSEYKKVLEEEHPSNPDFKEFSKEEVFISSRVLHMTDNILLLAYFEAYTKNEPQLVLDGYYTIDHINSIQPMHDPDTISPRDILDCYTGNNHKLAQYYLDNNFGEFKINSYHTNIELFLKALRDKKITTSAVASIKKYVSKKSTNKFNKSFFTALKALLQEDMELFSEQLENIVKQYPKIVGSNQFQNAMFAFFPALAYALYSIAFHHLNKEIFDKIKEPKSNIWWKSFAELNINNGFKEGKSYLKFEKELEFLNRRVY